MLKVAKKEKQIQNISNGVKTAATVGVIGAGVYVGYLGVLAYAAVKDGLDDVIGTIKQTAHEVPLSFWGWTTGSKKWKNPETGEEFFVPKTVTDDNGLVIENPAWRVPGFGGLTYLGMLAGNAFNPVTAAGYDPNTDQSQPPPTETWQQWIMRTDPDYDFENDEWSEAYLAKVAAAQAAAAAAAAEQDSTPTAGEAWMDWIRRIDPEYDFENDEWSESYLAQIAAAHAAAAAAAAAQDTRSKPGETWMEWIMRVDPDYDFENGVHSDAFLARMYAAREAAAAAAAAEAEKEAAEAVAERERLREEAGYDEDFVGPIK